MEIYNSLLGDQRNICTTKVPLLEWIDFLNVTKVYVSTYSCASGMKNPLGMKDKDAKALLCGALPLTEEFADADQFLVPGKERITFRDIKDLNDKIEYFDTHESERAEIVANGKKKVLAELTNERMWENAFKAFGII